MGGGVLCNNIYYQTLTEHWNGTTWLVVASPNVGTSNILTAIEAIAASDAWTVGTYYANGTQHSLFEHWNGTDWSVVASPDFGSAFNVLNGLSAVSANDIWAAGIVDDSAAMK